NSSIWMAYDGRTLAIPMAIILAACAAFLQWRDPQGQWGRTIFYPVAQGVLAVALVLSAANDQWTTRNWNMGTWNLSRMTPAQGCNAVPQNMTGYLQPYGIYPWAEPHLSIMLQESRSIHGIAIDQGFADYIGVHDPCARVKQGFLPENNLNHEVPLRGNRYFDFSTVLK
ncbi:MAG: hypothetical protein ACXVBW_13455, partial [Bdellovibrionota bacterium]